MVWDGMTRYDMICYDMVQYREDAHLREPVRFFHEIHGVAPGLPKPPADSASLQDALPAAAAAAGESKTKQNIPKGATNMPKKRNCTLNDTGDCKKGGNDYHGHSDGCY